MTLHMAKGLEFPLVSSSGWKTAFCDDAEDSPLEEGAGCATSHDTRPAATGADACLQRLIFGRMSSA